MKTGSPPLGARQGGERMSRPVPRSQICKASRSRHDPVSSCTPSWCASIASPQMYGPNQLRTAALQRPSHTNTLPSHPPEQSTSSLPEANFTQNTRSACPCERTARERANQPVASAPRSLARILGGGTLVAERLEKKEGEKDGGLAVP